MQTNKVVITVITATIAGMAGACVLTVCWLSYKGIQIPPELNTLTGGLVGACTAMLVKTTPTETTNTPPPAKVTIAQPSGQPVPVVETLPT